jgi:RNA exonuclease 4
VKNGELTPSDRKKKSRKRRSKSDYVALDCEMVGVGEGNESSVARVTVIDWYGKVLLDEHIQQTKRVTDYRTFVSGVTKDDLDAATMTIDRCRDWVRDCLHNRILIGHGLDNDLKALRIRHPWWLTRDTAKYEPFMQDRFNDGILWPRKLKELFHERLRQDIQIPGHSHDSFEDATAVLALYKLVRPQWENLMTYKISLATTLGVQIE